MEYSLLSGATLPTLSNSAQSDSCGAQLKWQQPWLKPYAQPIGEALQTALAEQPGIAAALAKVSHQYGEQVRQQKHSDGPARSHYPTFVPQANLPKGESYERFIRQHWAVPTREHLHDLFNGLIWLHWPQAKQQLNAIQSAEIERLGVQGQRGKIRDACTLFDENGAILLAPSLLHEALLAKDWLRLFWTERHLWANAQLLVFGHALLEQLCQPRKPICAHVLTLRLPVGDHSNAAGMDIEQLDANLAQLLTAKNMADKPLAPMPVLGIPGWCQANTKRSFYEDTSVFRPPRHSPLPASNNRSKPYEKN